MYIFGYKTTVSIQNLYILVKLFGKNFIFRVKSTNFLVFQDQIYIFGYKTTVFMQNLYILVKFFVFFNIDYTFYTINLFIRPKNCVQIIFYNERWKKFHKNPFFSNIFTFLNVIRKKF